ncbi:adhesion G protein-coupled receptor A3 [Vanessa atalanta]|uniref:adhesion G protein-coupled receptor A3 n=1 Tax=Vanessa atalanta TaxID=42275 RepID=UPI001FCCF5B8|nr:adhesion G protein-coupled receptor A3 [Vanessa atalanta]
MGKMKLFSIVVLFLLVKGSLGFCPSLCSCKGNRSSDGVTLDPQPGELLKLKCGGSPAQITELKEIDLSKLSTVVVSLNLSGNAISTLSRDLHLPNLQKLDLSRNQISLIESDAFYNMTSLQRLDLSHNQISNVYKEIFKGLVNLERLILSQNHISVLSMGTFDYLVGLKQIDITDNPLICDCELLWVGDWSRNTSVKLVGNPKCAFPDNMVNKTVRKLKIFLDLSVCGSVLPSNTLIVKPSHDQVVFEGDTLVLTCNAPFASVIAKYELKWIHPMLEICDVNVTSTDMQEEGLAETTIYFPNITNHHTGNWTCMYNDQNHIRHNYTVQVLVLSNQTQYCLTNYTINNKGLYSWPQLLLNHTATIPCRNGDGVAYRTCNENSSWGPANTSECSYISNITKLLQQFALLNVSLVQYSALNATERLAMLIQEKTYPLVEILDPDDVMFIAQAIRNYMQYISEERDLGSTLLDVISSVMNISTSVMSQAETQYGSCTDMVRAAEEISAFTSNVQGHKVNLAVERFPVGEGFSGVTCVWYSARRGDPPRLHCSTTNRTVAHRSALTRASDALIHASVQIPQSLLYSTTDCGTLLHTKTHDLVIAMYEDASMFPLLPEMEDGHSPGHRSKDYYGRSTKREDMNMEITSPVIGFRLMNVSLQGELLEPVIATVRARSVGGVDGRAATWDPLARRWTDNTSDCKVSHVVSEMIIITCTRLAYVGLLQNVETGIYGARTDGARFKVSHPAVYVGSLILIGCVSCATLTYIMCYPAIQMAKKTKHALINTWIAIGLLCFMYTLGIYQTEDVKLCQILGLLIHYLSLSCLLWMCVSASNMYKWVTKTHNPVRTPEDDIPPDVPIQKPILGLYLVGWGIALIVCGISGAVNLKDYAGYSQCFLSTAPALSALFIPGGILLIFLLILFLLIRCTIRNMNVQLSEGTQATENVDLEMWEPNQANEGAERRSIKSVVDSEIDDIEHTPIIQLRAQVIVLCLYMSVWTCGAIAVYRPLPAYLPYQEDICSIIYAVCSTVLGTFILFFYGIARSDVRAQWSLMHCYLQSSKQCCRNRSVFDSNQQNLPGNQTSTTSPQHIPNDNRSRSGSRSSNRTNTKTNNSGTFKAGAELNGQTLSKDVKNTNGKTPNINLVVLHRQQYRSNNSMMTYPESGTIGPEVFYNPNQMNVAKKFFKKQRQNMKRNCLELPLRRDCDDDSHISLPLPSKEAYNGLASFINAGNKVNNTNQHVERSNNGIKELRNTVNPNLLEDDSKDNFKSYSTDRKSWNKNEDPKHGRGQIINIYTNVPETQVPQHQIVKANVQKNLNGQRNSVSEECLQSHASEHPEMRTISQQCSLEYSSASEIAMPHTCSDQTLNTHSEMTSCQDTHSALCSTNEITDTESFGQYIDYLQPSKVYENKDQIDKSLQDISEECTMNSDEVNRSSTPHNLEAGLTEIDHLLENPDMDIEGSKEKMDDDKDTFFMAKTTYDFETCSTNASEQGFENESDIYCPNYQMSEVSIRSHGLYAPSPSSMCPNEISFSNEDVSTLESQYVNYDPGWRKTIKNNAKLGKYVPTPALSCPEVNRDSSPISFSSELDELYTQITSRDKDRTPRKEHLDVTVNSDVTLKPDSDSCVSEAISEIEGKGETTV